MVNREKLAKAEEKLTFAEFLTRPGQSEEYVAAAVKHVVNASTLAIQALTDSEVDSPRAIQIALMRFEEPQARAFAKSFMTMWKTDSSRDRRSVKMALSEVREFVNWIKKEQLR